MAGAALRARCKLLADRLWSRSRKRTLEREFGVRLLIADDDARAARQLASALAAFGHETVLAGDGRSALALATRETFDAVLCELMLPYVGGVELTRELREQRFDMPILILTVHGELADRLAGLAAGADDYLIKPVAPAEIDARLQAILRRAARIGDSGVMRAGDIEVNEVRYRALRGGRALALPKLEFQMLCELVRNKNAIVTRDMFYRKVWRYDAEPATNVVESYIRRLRTRLNAAGEVDPIETIRGVGYMLVDYG
jgi:two-component system, OmpR family, response regulator